MKLSTAHNIFLIHHLKTLQREIPLEGVEQKAIIADMFVHSIPELIEKIKRLEEYESGKAVAGTSKESDHSPIHLHQSRHPAMHMRLIPD